MLKWIVLAAAIIAGGILWYFFQHVESKAPTSLPPASKAITLVHAFKDGVHRFDGKLRLPPCSQISTNSFFSAKNPPSLTLLVTTTEQPLSGKNCLQFFGTIPFDIVTDAPKDVRTVLRVNGVDTPFNLVEVEWLDPRGTYLNLEN